MNTKSKERPIRGRNSVRYQPFAPNGPSTRKPARLPFMTRLCQSLLTSAFNSRSKTTHRARLAAVALACACLASALTACFSVRSLDPDVAAGRLIQLTHTDNSEKNPTWSPRGDKVAFECPEDGPMWDFLERDLRVQGDGRQVRNWPIHSFYVPGNICVVNADGSGRRQLTDGQGDDSDPAWSPDGSKLAFASRRGGMRDIFFVNADGTGLRRITNDSFVETKPTWSPDGSELAFTSFRDGQHDIFVIYDDGTGRRQITNDELKEVELTWSPDGSQIAFRGYLDVRRSGYPAHIYTVDFDGSNHTQVTDEPGYHSEPTWSPDGSQIAFISGGEYIWGLSVSVLNFYGNETTLLYPSIHNEEYGALSSVESPAWSPDGTRIAFAAKPWNGGPLPELELYVINVDGSGLKRLTYRDGDDTNPTWSPDGSKLAFESHLPGNRRYYHTPDIYAVVDFNPTDQPLSDNAYSDLVPVWSPDGTRIAYVSDNDGDDEIYISNANGTEIKQLTANDHADSRPAWSPDGTRIAYVSDYDGDEDLYIVNTDSTGVKRLTNNGHPDSRPMWSPDGTRIAYVSLHNGRHTDIFVMNTDGSDIVQLTRYDDIETNHYYGAPSWSPDGTRIAFVSEVHGRFKRHTMNADGTQRVTADFENCLSYDPSSWSPDSTRIAFSCQDSQIHIWSPLDGTVTSLEACDWYFSPRFSSSWSTGGTHIAYTCPVGGRDRRVHKINLNDGIVTRYTADGCMQGYSSWSPDESKIAILSFSGSDRVYDLCVAEPVLVP